MKPLIRILHLEDDPNDVELVQAKLEEAGLTCRLTAIQTRDDFEEALRKDGFDIILADFKLPMYDGISALRLAQELLPDVPFVFVSGTMGEEAAIEALKQGATDYVLKQQMLRLGPAVERALHEAKNQLERKRVKETLRISEERLKLALNSAQMGQWDWNIITGEVVWSQQCLALYGLPPDTQISYDKFMQALHPEDRERIDNALHRAVEDRTSYDEVKRTVWPDGSIHWTNSRGQVYCNAAGQPARMIGVSFDITEWKKAEEKHQSHLWFMESLDQVNRTIQGTTDPEQMMSNVLDVVMSIFDCDRTFLLYPCDPEALSWFAPMERNRPEYPGVLDSGLEMPMDAEVAKTFRILLDADGPVKFGPGTPNSLPKNVSERFGIKSFMSVALRPKIDRPWQFGIHQCSHPRIWTSEEERLFNEIGRRLSDALTSLLTNRDLRESEEFLDNIVENIPDMIFVKDAQTLSFVKFNKAGERLLGYSREELLGKNDYDFFPKEEADFFTTKDREVLSTKKLADIPEETIKNGNNDERILHTKKIPIMDETGKPQYLLGISEDITKNKKLEAQLRQAQKMESVGRLAGGVAHDFNNMLGVIMVHAELGLDGLDPGQPLYADLQEILKAAGHSADLTRQLLAFARKQTVAPRVLDLNKIVAGMLKMLGRLIGEDIDLSWLPKAGVWPVKVDPSQIDQILANLCVNARDAITGVGKVTIETGNITFDETYCADHPGLVPGEYVLLAVGDDGHGMDKETLDKIFEPFFTTKEMGKGTGLGLATVYGIVKQNNGFINVYSEPGHGTAFKIYLPRHAGMAEPLRKERPAALDLQGHETILLVEDDPATLEMGERIVSRFGYRVLTALTPSDAIRLAREHTGKIQLLITDVIMPEMNGCDLAKKLTSICPKLKHLYMSGYTGDIIARHGVLDENENFIQKPFSMNTLAAKVREVLDGKPGGKDMVRQPFRETEMAHVMEKGSKVGQEFDESMEQKTETRGPSSEDILAPEALAKLPNDLTADLEQAVIDLDLDRIKSFIEQIHELNPLVAQALTDLADDFQYDKLLALIEIKGDEGA